MKKISYFILAAVTVVLAACGDGNTPEQPEQPEQLPEGALKGKFTVDDKDTQVLFSRGNLQYQGSTNTWRFAENQWDFVGGATEGTVIEAGVKSNNAGIDNDYSGWIDLFGWGTGNAPAKSSTSTYNYYYFVNWGTNAISNGGKTSNMWRTLDKDEWAYVFNGRTNASELFGRGKVNGIEGVILLPDNWDKPLENNKTYTTDEWKALEEDGAVFLPCAGYRSNTLVQHCNFYGYYWSATPNGTERAYLVRITNSDIEPQYQESRFFGFSVRLVQDVK